MVFEVIVHGCSIVDENYNPKTTGQYSNPFDNLYPITYNLNYALCTIIVLFLAAVQAEVGLRRQWAPTFRAQDFVLGLVPLLVPLPA